LGLRKCCFSFPLESWWNKTEPLQGHAKAPAEPCGLGVHGGRGAHDLPRAQGPCVPHTTGGIRGLLRDILQARIWCAIALISLLDAIALLKDRRRRSAGGE
jgi:hypothetical protein